MLGHNDVRRSEEEEQSQFRGPPFIVTYTGKVFPYDHITPDCIDIRDIAHALSHLCRFTGHTNMFYSVAQHSLLVAEKMQGGAAEKLAGLLHDAAEAYTNDLASPLKRYMSEGVCGCNIYADLQDGITAMIYNKWGVKYVPSEVRLYDAAACVFEAEGFMGLSPDDLAKYRYPTHLRELWQPWDPKEFAGKNSDREFGEVEASFLDQFEALKLGRYP